MCAVFCSVFFTLLVSCNNGKGNTKLVVTPETPENKESFNVTFKVNGSFGHLKAKVGENEKKTASTDAISAKKGDEVRFIAEPVNGWEVKEWKITGGTFTEGGKAKNNEAKVLCTQDMEVSVEFTQIKQEEESKPFTISSLNIGVAKDFKLNNDEYKAIMDKIKMGDKNQVLKTSALKLSISIWTSEDMSEVEVNGEKQSPDHGEPQFFKGEITVGKGKVKHTIILKGKNLKSELVFSVEKVAGKNKFPESEMQLFIGGVEATTYEYSHLSDTDEGTYPLIESKKAEREVKLKTSNALLAGRVIYLNQEYPFSEDSLEAVFTISDITENAKTIDIEIVPKSEEDYENLHWHFKIIKIKDINPVRAFLYIDDDLVSQEVTDALLEDMPKTATVTGNTALISVRTGVAQEIEGVVIDGKQATFRKKGNALKYRWEATIENITENEREIVIVITPKEGKGLDVTTWKFNIKKSS